MKQHLSTISPLDVHWQLEPDEDAKTQIAMSHLVKIAEAVGQAVEFTVKLKDDKTFIVSVEERKAGDV
jgi:hypothetical protein